MSKDAERIRQSATDALPDKIFCPWCKKDVTFHMNRVEHRKELLRTIFTAGLWAPFWLLQIAASKSKLCDECGNDTRTYEV